MTAEQAGDSVVAIVLAAGTSSRMSGEDKLWTDLGGRPAIARSIEAMARVEGVTALVLVAPADRHAALVALVPAGVEARCVEGGARRRDSVAAGLEAALDAGWVLVHDGARPLATTELASRVLGAARQHGAAIPAVPVADTIKRADEAGRVVETVPRADLRAAQTPQAFEARLLRHAHASSVEDATDDAELVERLGAPVWLVEGDPANIKITRPTDLVVARALLAAREGA
ncbi:MAG: 2-C-methyl-D-erythritol 4-phosphate cytidylyltransferase [Dehalococcoidia bacterium]